MNYELERLIEKLNEQPKDYADNKFTRKVKYDICYCEDGITRGDCPVYDELDFWIYKNWSKYNTTENPEDIKGVLLDWLNDLCSYETDSKYTAREYRGKILVFETEFVEGGNGDCIIEISNFRWA